MIADPAAAIPQAPKISGLRPIRSDSREAGMIAITLATTTTTRITTYIPFASTLFMPKRATGRSRRS